MQGSGGLILSMPTQIEHRTASQTGRTPRPRAVARDASAADGFGQNGPRWRDFRATVGTDQYRAKRGRPISRRRPNYEAKPNNLDATAVDS